jgi:hypothetical protein
VGKLDFALIDSLHSSKTNEVGCEP